MKVIRTIWQPKHCKAGASGANTTVIASNGPSARKMHRALKFCAGFCNHFKPKWLLVGEIWMCPDMPPCPRRSSGTPYHHTSRRNRPSKNLEPQRKFQTKRSQVEPTNTFRLYEPVGFKIETNKESCFQT